MNIAAQIVEFEKRGFSREQSETILLLSETAKTLFADFPDHFLMFGGATLVFFHQSVRHSADLDLLSTTEELPRFEEIAASLKAGLQPVAEALRISPLDVTLVSGTGPDMKLMIYSNDRRPLYTVDLTRMGNVIASEIVTHTLDGSVPVIKSASRDFLLLQKAEAFMFRRHVKARDAYDILTLQRAGASLSDNLKAHLSDRLMSDEVGAERISGRIEKLNEKLYKSELENRLPSEVYAALQSSGFAELKNAVTTLFADWL